eukprot:18800_1
MDALPSTLKDRDAIISLANTFNWHVLTHRSTQSVNGKTVRLDEDGLVAFLQKAKDRFVELLNSGVHIDAIAHWCSGHGSADGFHMSGGKEVEVFRLLQMVH